MLSRSSARGSMSSIAPVPALGRTGTAGAWGLFPALTSLGRRFHLLRGLEPRAASARALPLPGRGVLAPGGSHGAHGVTGGPGLPRRDLAPVGDQVASCVQVQG